VFGRGASNPLYPVTLGLLLLFAIAVALHAEMFRLRPATGHLTRFYLAMSIGGMLGGLFCAIVAPLVFDWAYEYPLLILGAAVLVPQIPLVPWLKSQETLLKIALPAMAVLLAIAVYMMRMYGFDSRMILVGSILISLVALACLGRPFAFAYCLLALMVSYDNRGVLSTSVEGGRTRSYFGIYEVYERPDDFGRPVRVLTHGTTLHGKQNLTPGLEQVPTTYYAARSGVGLAMTAADSMFGPRPRIGVVGLGSGTLSCFARPNQAWTFFEIDPAMVEVARNQFTFLRGCAPQARIVLGDARLSLAQQPANSIDILAVDAFSSDAVPMHLLTHEALQVYGGAVQQNGIVLFHISNRYLDLRPVIAALAQRNGWSAAILEYMPTPEEEEQNATISVWIAVSRNRDTLNRLAELSGRDSTAWRVLEPRPGFSAWTDDHASILPILNFDSFWPRGE
jgi:spermidine synthase